MRNDKLKPWIKVLLFICALAMVFVLFVPLWKIDLAAPQYPEGLMLLIFPDKLSGNVDIINGLNHYIGMKTLHTADFVEFTLLPYFISFFGVAFILVAVLNRKKWLYLLFILFVSFGIIAICDFWRWEYNYGHNLNPDAAIIVPGMSYQPPLIGFKQLLNFGAYSMPDTGGWLFIGVGVLLLYCTVRTWIYGKKKILESKLTTVLLPFFLLTGLASCTTGPQPIKTGRDNCHFCKMTISDERFGAEIITDKGKIYKFDDVHCILSYLKISTTETARVKDIYLTNFCGKHQLHNATSSFLLKSESLRSPMGGNIAAFDNRDSMLKIQQLYPGNIVQWSELQNK